MVGNLKSRYKNLGEAFILIIKSPSVTLFISSLCTLKTSHQRVWHNKPSSFKEKIKSKSILIEVVSNKRNKDLLNYQQNKMLRTTGSCIVTQSIIQFVIEWSDRQNRWGILKCKEYFWKYNLLSWSFFSRLFVGSWTFGKTNDCLSKMVESLRP